MSGMQFSVGPRHDPIVKGSPEALVALLHDRGDSAQTLAPIAERWAATVPTTAFIALDEIEAVEPPLSTTASQAMRDVGVAPEPTGAEPTGLDRAARQLGPLLKQQLRSRRLDAGRLVLVGFGHGGTLVLNMVLRQGWSCAGVLAFAATLVRPLPRLLRLGHKIRLIECVGDGPSGHSSVREAVALLTARGIDARGAVLAGSMLSDAAIRHGGAYLVELVATAQRGDRFNLDRESSHAS